MKINIKKFLDFLDGAENSRKGDASAIIGMIGEDLNAAAYKHYKIEVEKSKIEIQKDHVGQGTRKGKRLDRWIEEKSTNKEILFQCEIKNFAAKAIGGKILKADADKEKTIEITDYYLKRELNNSFSKSKSHPNNITKVLIPMCKPKRYKNWTVEPLLIYWIPISDTNQLNPLFSIPLKPLKLPIETPFSKLNVFSVSLYFRKLLWERKSTIIDLDLPNFEYRMKIFQGFIYGTNK
jgi:hypothetical protein